MDGVPFLLPEASSSLRRTLETAFDALDIRPKFVGELDDPGLAEVVAEAGRAADGPRRRAGVR